MKKNTTNTSKWAFMGVVIVIAMFGDNNHFYQNLSGWVPEPGPALVTPIRQPRVEVRPLVDTRQLECMAKNIYYEARGESVRGQIAVARVVMNRVRHHAFANTPCKVINQANNITVTTGESITKKVRVCQFSWVCESKTHLNKNSQAYQKALQIATEVLAYDAHANLLPKNTLFFHSVRVNPNWGYRKVAVIGNHIFYAKGR